MLADHKNSYRDTPNDYVELETPATVRYVWYRNIDVPTPNLTISELCIFGLGFDKALCRPDRLTLDRHADRRGITICWGPVKGAQEYDVLRGIVPNRLYSSWMVHDNAELLMKSLVTNQYHYLAVEAFSENGTSLPPEARYIE